MQAILLGQNFQMQRVWTEDYRNTGTFHALVISGTHVAIWRLLPVLSAPLLRAREPGAAAHRGGGVALRAGRGLGRALRALGRGADART